MLKICKENWAKYSNNLRERFIKEHQDDGNKIYCYEYLDIVKIIIEEIMNQSNEREQWSCDEDEITRVDNGCYQGTLLFVIPMSTYQPSSYEYLITYIEYGSCSVCDTLQAIQSEIDREGPLSDEVLDDLMQLCKDIVFNIKRPFYDKYVMSKDDNWSEVE